MDNPYLLVGLVLILTGVFGLGKIAGDYLVKQLVVGFGWFLGVTPLVRRGVRRLRYHWRLATLDSGSNTDMEFYLRGVYWRLYDAYQRLPEEERRMPHGRAIKRDMDGTAARMAHLGLRPDPSREVPSYSKRDVNLADAMQEMGHWDRFYWRDA